MNNVPKKFRGYVAYAKVQKHNGNVEKPQYELSLLPVDKETETAMVNEGLKHARFSLENKDLEKAGQIKKASVLKGFENITSTATDGIFILKKDALDKEGNPTAKPQVVDKNAKPITALIGNGSLVEVAVTLYNGKTSFGKPYTKATLLGVQVLDLVPFEPTLFDAVSDGNDVDDTVSNVLS